MKKIKTGFTLIELLVVISIIAMLATLLMPALNSSRAKARQMQCLNNEKQLGMAVMMYANDKNEYIATYWDGTYSWTDLLAPYCTKFTDPEAAKTNRPSNYASPRTPNFLPFICPVENKIWGDYTIGWVNYATNYGANRAIMTSNTMWDYPIKKFTVLTRPSECGLIYDGKTKSYVLAFVDILTINGYTHWRHNNSISLLFADGHAAGFKEQPVLPIAYDPVDNNKLWK